MSPSSLPQSLIIFGHGYAAGFIARNLREAGVQVVSTRRVAAGEVRGFDGERVDPRLTADIRQCQAVLSSIPPDAAGDPAARVLAEALQAAGHIRWFGYLSSTAVYAAGDIDETTPVAPGDETGKRRVLAEQQWQALATAAGAASALFRLPAIYGPGRNAITQLRAGTARLIDAPGVRFNRVHVEDLARCVLAALQRASGHAVYLPCDEEAAASAEVLRHAAALTGLPLPPAQTLDDPALSPTLQRFYRQGEKHLDNRRTRQMLGWQPRFASYREGLQAALPDGMGM